MTKFTEIPKKSSLLDLSEKIVLLLLFSFFARNAILNLLENKDSPWLVLVLPSLLVVSEGAVVILVLLRKSTNQVSTRLKDWLVSFLATVAPLLVIPETKISSLLYIGFPIMLVGIAWQIYAKITLGLRFGVVPANRGICSHGPYKIVRHPIYFGYFIMHIGFLFSSGSLWNLVCYSIVYALLIVRILLEEELLSKDDAYRNYMSKVKYRFLPGVY